MTREQWLIGVVTDFAESRLEDGDIFWLGLVDHIRSLQEGALLRTADADSLFATTREAIEAYLKWRFPNDEQ